MRTLKHNQAHISTQDVMGKAIAKNPQLSVYYNDREHVTIHSTKLLTALSTISHATHKQAQI